MPRPLITLTTDFGISSPYVAQMKGVILGICPAANCVDITHAIPPQNIVAGAIVLRDVIRYFPAGTIHVAVVDPGVGTSRQIVYAEIEGRHYLAPDNGLLSLLAREAKVTRLHAVTNRAYWRDEISSTFHGRDIFAPVAAHLALGVAAEQLGPPLPGLTMLAWPEPQVGVDFIFGQIVDIDSFGNLTTNIAAPMLAGGSEQHRQTCEVQLAGRTIVGLCQTYGDVPADTLIALLGSSGYLEVAQAGGSAAKLLAAAVGDTVVVRWPARS